TGANFQQLGRERQRGGMFLGAVGRGARDSQGLAARPILHESLVVRLPHEVLRNAIQYGLPVVLLAIPVAGQPRRLGGARGQPRRRRVRQRRNGNGLRRNLRRGQFRAAGERSHFVIGERPVEQAELVDVQYVFASQRVTQQILFAAQRPL